MKILLLGDIVGKPGRQALAKFLPSFKAAEKIDLVLANAENAAHGFGVTRSTLDELRSAGVNFFTSGNHVWKNEQGRQYLSTNPSDVIRPANYQQMLPGRGWTEGNVAGKNFLLINLIGQVFLGDEDNKNPVTSPYEIFDQIYHQFGQGKIVIVDLHAEATGEKRCFGWYADGRAAIVVGTHTHVQTADEQILPAQTAYITDLGMVGARQSSLGMDKDLAIKKNVLKQDVSLEPPESASEVMVQGVLVELDEATLKPKKIARIDQKLAL